MLRLRVLAMSMIVADVRGVDKLSIRIFLTSIFSQMYKTMRTVAAHLFKRFRKRRRLSQEQVEADTGVSQSQISKGEKYGFTQGTAERLASAYGLSVEKLMRPPT